MDKLKQAIFEILDTLLGYPPAAPQMRPAPIAAAHGDGGGRCPGVT